MAAATLPHGPLTTLLKLTEQGCQILTPLVKRLYSRIDESTSMAKKDSSMFSIADGIVQHVFLEWFFKDRFSAMVGEEKVVLNLTTRPYRVGKLDVPEEFWGEIDDIHQRIAALSSQLAAIPRLSEVTDTVFLDPIDGTREFCSGLGEQSTICVGFARAGHPVAGLVFRPITDPPTYALGCAEEHFADLHLRTGTAPAPVPQLLTTNGSISPFLANLIGTGAFVRRPSGGVGNKMLILLEEPNSIYLQDRGVSRWDTCGAQAVLEATGGVLVKLAPFVAADLSAAPDVEAALLSYTYRETDTNLDFVPGQANFSLYNRASADHQPGTPIQDPAHALPYSNLAGLLAIASSAWTPDRATFLRKLSTSVHQVIAAGAAPAYD